MIIPILYIPTVNGDVRLERIDDKSTRVIVSKASPLESKGLRDLAEYAVKKGWLDKTDDAVFDEGSFILKAEIKKAQAKLAKALKPGRETVTIVRFAGGQMEELMAEPTADTAAVASTPQTGLGPPAAAARATGDAEEAKTAQAAATVAKPYLGCPPPDFAAAVLRANRVLEQFLTEEQKEDFRKYNRFITIGGATGHRLMITSRLARTQLATWQRSLYDLDDETPLCVHDWDVPPAEEMLALHLLVAQPQHEMYLRQLEADVEAFA